MVFTFQVYLKMSLLEKMIFDESPRMGTSYLYNANIRHKCVCIYVQFMRQVANYEIVMWSDTQMYDPLSWNK